LRKGESSGAYFHFHGDAFVGREEVQLVLAPKVRAIRA
jgi:hypothetical protein